jgi:Fe2+ or Zn2+ uptake regulation protein
VTEPRKAMLRILTQEHGPFTAEEVHRLLAKGAGPRHGHRSLTPWKNNVVRR